jgi:hypothetical protein
MNADEALKQVEQLLIARSPSTLPYPQSAIFKGVWDGLTYEAISDQPRRYYEVSYIRGLGAELCNQLSEVLGVKVRKPTFQEDVMEGLERRSRPIPAQPNTTSLNPTFDSLDQVPDIDSPDINSPSIDGQKFDGWDEKIWSKRWCSNYWEIVVC